MKICSIEGCDSRIQARGWCSKHYKRWRQHGDPLKTLTKINLDRGSNYTHADSMRWTRYRITPEEYEALLKKCMICGETKGKLCVDHDHITKKVRGILCDSCNISVGRLGDTIEHIEKVLEYLRNARNK